MFAGILEAYVQSRRQYCCSPPWLGPAKRFVWATAWSPIFQEPVPEGPRAITSPATSFARIAPGSASFVKSPVSRDFWSWGFTGGRGVRLIWNKKRGRGRTAY
jgi:hypothetical protein